MACITQNTRNAPHFVKSGLISVRHNQLHFFCTSTQILQKVVIKSYCTLFYFLVIIVMLYFNKINRLLEINYKIIHRIALYFNPVVKFMHFTLLCSFINVELYKFCLLYEVPYLSCFSLF